MEFNLHVDSHFELKLGFLYLWRIISVNYSCIYTRTVSFILLMHTQNWQKKNFFKEKKVYNFKFQTKYPPNQVVENIIS